MNVAASICSVRAAAARARRRAEAPRRRRDRSGATATRAGQPSRCPRRSRRRACPARSRQPRPRRRKRQPSGADGGRRRPFPSGRLRDLHGPHPVRGPRGTRRAAGSRRSGCARCQLAEHESYSHEYYENGRQSSPSGGLDTSASSAGEGGLYGFDEVVAVSSTSARSSISKSRSRAAGRPGPTKSPRRPEGRLPRSSGAGLKTNALYEGKYRCLGALAPGDRAGVAELASEVGAGRSCTAVPARATNTPLRTLVKAPTRPARDRAAPRPDLDARRGDRLRAREAPPVAATREAPFSSDENCRSRDRGGRARGPWAAPPEEPNALTGDPASAPPPSRSRSPSGGRVPCSLDGEELALAE